MKNNIYKKIGISLIASAVLANSLSAAGYTYTFGTNNTVTYSSAGKTGTVSGSFKWDSSTSTISRINVTAVLDGTTYKIDEAINPLSGYVRAATGQSTSDYGFWINSSALTDTSATLTSSNFALGICLSVTDGLCSNIGTQYRLDFSNTMIAKENELLGTMQDLKQSRFYTVAELFDNATDTDLSAFATELTNYSGSEMAAKLEQATPTITTSAPQVNRQVLTSASNIVSTRQSTTTGLNSGDEAFSDKNVWAKPFGSKTNQSDIDGVSGFDANTYGIAVGVDGEYKDDNRFGISFFYANSDVDTNNVDQTNKIDSYTLVAYGSNPITKIENAKLFYQLGYGIQNNNSDRTIALTSKVASADYQTQSLFAMVKGTKEYKKDDKLTFIPEISLSTSYFKSPTYTETGAGGLNLTTNSFSSNSFVTSVGTSLIYKRDDKIDFNTRVVINYDSNNKTNSVTSSYQGGGSTFSTEGLKNSAFGYDLELGITDKLKDDLTLDVNYELNAKASDFYNHTISANFNWNF